jgi:hypothetical protein
MIQQALSLTLEPMQMMSPENNKQQMMLSVNGNQIYKKGAGAIAIAHTAD